MIPSEVIDALELLEKSGFEAYIVGGCVRDIKLNKTPHDWDITTSALPQEVKEVFKDFHVVDTGIKHGTVTVICNKLPLEITTYRVDGEYSDNRHPKEVSFTRNLEDDLSRRDFTVNALAYNPKTGVVDRFNSLSDLEGKTIRAIGECDKRFEEDALRLIRALRFSAVLDFDIETETSKSIHKNRELLKNISSERIFEELNKFLCGKGERVTSLLIEYRDVFAVIIPELEPCFDFDQKNKHHIFDVYDHIAYSVGYSAPIPVVRMALLFHDIGKPECFFTDEDGVGHFYGHGDISACIAERALKRLKSPSKFAGDVTTLVRYHDYPIECNKKSIKRRLNKFGREILDLLLEVKKSDGLAHNPDSEKSDNFIGFIDDTKALIDDISESGECFSVKDLCVDGNDLIELGYERGPLIGTLLKEILGEVIDGRIENEAEQVIEFLKRRSLESGTEKD